MSGIRQICHKGVAKLDYAIQKLHAFPILCAKLLIVNKEFVTNIDVSEKEDPRLCGHQACLLHILTKSGVLKKNFNGHKMKQPICLIPQATINLICSFAL